MGESPGVHAGTDRMLWAGRIQSTQMDCSKRLTGYQAASTMGCQRHRPRTTWHATHLARQILLQAGRVCSRRLHRASQVRRSAAGGCIATARVHHFGTLWNRTPRSATVVVDAVTWAPVVEQDVSVTHPVPRHARHRRAGGNEVVALVTRQVTNLLRHGVAAPIQCRGPEDPL